jgi:hypothetical protein
MLADNKLIYIRPLSQSCSQNLFRIFIWRDMLVQIWEGRPWSFFIGFDFGKPLRSISIEILDWAGGDWKIEWGGCGWITAHNSFLYMIYMGGIVGLLSVGIVLSIWVRMCAVSVKRKNTTAILLCGILVYWITSVFFGVILELPYYAIPFWSLFGMTYAYIFKR